MDSSAIAVINFKDFQVHLSFGVPVRDDLALLCFILFDTSARLLPPTPTTITPINIVTVKPLLIPTSRESRFVSVTTMFGPRCRFQLR